MSETPPKSLPPYVPFETFVNFIGQLNKMVVPTHIDKSVMPSMSGATQSHLLSALKSLNLIDADGTATIAFRRLVESNGTANWQSAMHLVLDYYTRLLAGLNPETATPKQVREKFKEAGVEGTMADRAIRFYIRTMEEAGVPFSPHLKVRKKIVRRSGQNRSSADTGRTTTNGSTDTPTGDNPPALAVPKGMMRYPLHFRRPSGAVEGMLMVPEDITEADCKLIEAQLTVLRIYATPDPK